MITADKVPDATQRCCVGRPNHLISLFNAVGVVCSAYCRPTRKFRGIRTSAAFCVQSKVVNWLWIDALSRYITIYRKFAIYLDDTIGYDISNIETIYRVDNSTIWYIDPSLKYTNLLGCQILFGCSFDPFPARTQLVDRSTYTGATRWVELGG